MHGQNCANRQTDGPKDRQTKDKQTDGRTGWVILVCPQALLAEV